MCHVTHLQAARPSKGEQFYIRALLNNHLSALFIDARTIDGVVYSTCQQAVSALSLFINEREAEFVMFEAI